MLQKQAKICHVCRLPIIRATHSPIKWVAAVKELRNSLKGDEHWRLLRMNPQLQYVVIGSVHNPGEVVRKCLGCIIEEC